MRRSTPMALALIFSLAACSGTTSGSRRSDSVAESSGPAPEFAERRSSTEAPNGDVRVTAFQPTFQPKTNAVDRRPVPAKVMILVNENHSGRETLAGRLGIAFNDPNRLYKVMTEEQAGNLLKSLENYGWARVATAFEPGDERYMSEEDSGTRFKGALFVETAKGRFKVVGMRPNGSTDVAGADRYQVFVNLKGVVASWFQATASEKPIGDATPKPARLAGD